MDIKLHKSNFNKSNEKPQVAIKPTAEWSIKSNILYIYLKSGEVINVIINEKNNYRIRKNKLYKGWFKKLGIIEFIELKEESAWQ